MQCLFLFQHDCIVGIYMQDLMEWPKYDATSQGKCMRFRTPNSDVRETTTITTNALFSCFQNTGKKSSLSILFFPPTGNHRLSGKDM